MAALNFPADAWDDKINRQKLAADAAPEAYRHFFERLPVPAIYFDKLNKALIPNDLLAKELGYLSVADFIEALKIDDFDRLHIKNEDIYKLDGLLKSGYTLKGLPINLVKTDGTAFGCFMSLSFANPLVGNRFDRFCGIFAPTAMPVDFSDDFEPGGLSKERSEFLANVSHELRTPLNIILGMIGIISEDEGLSPDSRDQLTMAQEAAGSLLGMINDLITVTYLEAGRLHLETSAFDANILAANVIRNFEAKAAFKSITISYDDFVPRDHYLVGGYVFLAQALEKLVSNAVKFTPVGGRVHLATKLENVDGKKADLVVTIRDTGPGLVDDQVLHDTWFTQGDSSSTRAHGGLGMGLKLAHSLVRRLNGRLEHHNLPEGGTEFYLAAPVDLES